jgi:GTP-binding protein HflX
LRLPRLAGSGTALSRLGGGGSRPGETKLETDRPHPTRIHAIKEDIDQVRKRRARRAAAQSVVRPSPRPT